MWGAEEPNSSSCPASPVAPKAKNMNCVEMTLQGTSGGWDLNRRQLVQAHQYNVWKRVAWLPGSPINGRGRCEPSAMKVWSNARGLKEQGNVC